MAFLASLMLKYNGNGKVDYLKHGSELLEASRLMKEWIDTLRGDWNGY